MLGKFLIMNITKKIEPKVFIEEVTNVIKIQSKISMAVFLCFILTWLLLLNCKLLFAIYKFYLFV